MLSVIWYPSKSLEVTTLNWTGINGLQFIASLSAILAAFIHIALSKILRTLVNIYTYLLGQNLPKNNVVFYTLLMDYDALIIRMKTCIKTVVIHYFHKKLFRRWTWFPLIFFPGRLLTKIQQNLESETKIN